MFDRRPARILIADDREENRYIMSRMLTAEGYECDQAESGGRALESATGRHPDLIILDVRLPDISGYEVCRRLKEDARTSSIMILQVSASFVSNDDRVRSLNAGADGYLTHPIDRMVLIATVRALLRLRKAEASARESAQQWQTTFDSLAEGVALIDREGRVARSNDAFRLMSGAKAPFDTAEDASLLLERLIGTSEPLEQDGKRYSSEFMLGRRNVLVSVSRIDERADGEKVLILTDNTDRKLADYALRTAEKLAATGKLANAIAHEINNPLEALTNLVFLARGTESMEAIQSLLDGAAKELDRVARITRQALAFHRDTRVPIEINLGDLLTDVVTMIERTAAAHRVRIVLQRRSAGNIFGFPGQLTQVFSNLLRNAAEASPPESEVTIRLTSVDRGGRAGNRVTIHDRGAGIPADIQNSIFDPFFTTKDLRGSGLGLWVSRSLISRHRGTIRFRSRTSPKGSGTSFEVFLPSLNLDQLSAAAD